MLNKYFSNAYYIPHTLLNREYVSVDQETNVDQNILFLLKGLYCNWKDKHQSDNWDACAISISDSIYRNYGLPQWLRGKESACNEGDAGSIPGSGRSPGGGHSNLLQYSFLENPLEREAWWATVHRVTKNVTWLKWVSRHTHKGTVRFCKKL